MPFLNLFPRHPQLAMVLLALIFTTAAVTVGAAVLISIRNTWNRYRQFRIHAYNTTMTDLLLLALDNQAPVERPLIRVGDEVLFRDLLLAQIKSLGGAEKEYFLVLYRRMGYLRQDLADCQSPFWARRLKALSRINVVYGLDFGNTVGNLVQDAHELVALTALKILSRNENTFDDDTIVDLLKASGRKRRHIVAEILANVARTRGPSILVRCLAEPDLPPSVKEVVLSLVSHFRASEAVPELIRHLGLSTAILDSEIILALQKIGDPQATPAIQNYLTHANPALRARALLALDAFQALDQQELEILAYTDLDPTFQRALKSLLKPVAKEAA